jgi:hypothetical protein
VPPGASTASPNRPGIQSFGSGVPVDAGSLRVAGMLMFVAAIIYLLVRLFLIFGFSAVVNMIGFSFLEYPVLILLIIPAILTAGAAIFMVQHANHASSAGGAAAGLLFYAISLIAGALLMAFHAVAIQRSYFSSMWMVEYALDIGFLSNILTVLNVVALVLALATIGFTFAATRQDYIDRGSLIAVLVVLVLIIVFSLFGMFALPAIYLLINEMGGVWAINIVSMITSLVIALFYTAFLALEGRMLLSFI